jgi:glycosyltransferase involved in cell wall biosynthesis
MSQPSISVIVTCYNYARYVGRAIESLLAQSYSNREIIVVNDGSTDDSAEVIARYAAQIRSIDQNNRGSIAAYNRGFAESSGDVVIFLDADDLLEPGALASVAEVWSPDLAKVQYDLRIIDADDRDLGRRFCNFTPDYDANRVRESFRKNATYRWPVTVGNAYSRHFAAQIFPLEIEHGPDGALNTIAPLYGEVATIPRVLGAYRLHGRNRWSSDGADQERLPERISHRQSEVLLLRRHAAARGIPLPDGNVLDHELPFINYRLMAWRLGLEYPGKTDDSPAKLLASALSVIRSERLPLRLALQHLAWFSVLSGVPPALAASLIRLRFNRAAIAQSAERRVKGAFERWQGAA